MRKFERPQLRRPQKENLLTTIRRAMLAQVSGDVIELGGGDGMSVPYYPLDRVTSLTIVDRRFFAGVREHDFDQVPVNFILQTKDKLPLENSSFDFGCVFFALSSMKDPYCALCELRRLLRPGGQVQFLDFYRPGGPAGFAFDGANLIRKVTTKGSISRNVISMLEVSGFQIETVSRCGHIFVCGSAKRL